MVTSDWSNGLAIRSTRFFMRFAGFWIWNDRREKNLIDLAWTYTIAAIMVAWIITGLDLWHCRGNFHQGAYAACNAMTVLIILIKLVVFSIRRDDFMDLIKYCYANFWQRNYDSFGESILRNCENRCVYFVWTFTFFAQCTVCSYTMHPIIENLGKNETDRILPFNIWMDFPITSTPYYEIMFSVETLALFHSGICYFCFDNLLCIMNVHAAGQFRILQKRLELMYNVRRNDDRRESGGKFSADYRDVDSPTNFRRVVARHDEMKNCIRDHQMLIRFTDMVESVYTYVILGQVVMFSLLICLVSYQAVLADGTITSRMIFIVHSGGTFTQLFMFTLTCDDLMCESEGVADAAYRAGWYRNLADPVSQEMGRDLILVIARSRRPCCLTAGHFFPISLATFRTIMSTSMSYLTLLRQGQELSVE